MTTKHSYQTLLDMSGSSNGPRTGSAWAAEVAEQRTVSPVRARHERFLELFTRYADLRRAAEGYSTWRKSDKAEFDAALDRDYRKGAKQLTRAEFAGTQHDPIVVLENHLAAFDAGESRERYAVAQWRENLRRRDTGVSHPGLVQVDPRTQVRQPDYDGRMPTARKLSTGLDESDVDGMAQQWGITPAMVRAQAAPLSEASLKYASRADPTTKAILRGRRNRVTTSENEPVRWAGGTGFTPQDVRQARTLARSREGR